MPQFIQVCFGPMDARRYTYVNNGEPLVVGDIVKVPNARDQGSKHVEVMAVDVDEPTFVCKAILGKLTGEEIDQDILRRAAVSQ